MSTSNSWSSSWSTCSSTTCRWSNAAGVSGPNRSASAGDLSDLVSAAGAGRAAGASPMSLALAVGCRRASDDFFHVYGTAWCVDLEDDPVRADSAPVLCAEKMLQVTAERVALHRVESSPNAALIAGGNAREPAQHGLGHEDVPHRPWLPSAGGNRRAQRPRRLLRWRGGLLESAVHRRAEWLGELADLRSDERQHFVA